MKINYCLPIIKKKKADVLKKIDETKDEYQYFEVWLDTIEDLDKEFVKELINKVNTRLILLFHREILKNSEIDFSRKLRILDELNNTDVFFDFDILEKKEIAYLKKKRIKVKTIISYHNYQNTPKDFSKILDKMKNLKPTIYKISTQCNSEKDALRLLQILLEFHRQKKQCIVLGMGEFGTITRVFGTLWGNALIYAPQTKQEAPASGQLTKQQLEEIINGLVP